MKPETVMVLIGVLSPVISAIVTLLGLMYSHQADKKRISVDEKRAENESITAEAEAQKIKAESEKLGIENAIAQVNYYSSIVEDLRKEVKALSLKDKENTDKIYNLEMKLNEAEIEKINLSKENARLKAQVDAQEKEIQDLRRKIEVLEAKNKE